MCQTFNWLPSSSQHSPPESFKLFLFFVAFSKRIPLASQTFYSYCLRIQTPFQFAIFFILFVSVNSSENRRQLLCFKQAKDLKKIFAGIRNAMNENIIQSAESEIHSREAQMVMQELFWREKDIKSVAKVKKYNFIIEVFVQFFCFQKNDSVVFWMNSNNSA